MRQMARSNLIGTIAISMLFTVGFNTVRMKSEDFEKEYTRYTMMFHTYAADIAQSMAAELYMDDEEEILDKVETTLLILPDDFIVEEDLVTPIEEIVQEYEEISKVFNLNTSYYTADFISNNTALKEYTDSYASFTFDDIEFDGLAVLAQANTESYYMCDGSSSLSALYPSRFVDFINTEDISNLGIDKVYENKHSLNGLYVKIPYSTNALGPIYAWSTGAGVYEQGPMQTRVTNLACQQLGDAQSEAEKLADVSFKNTVMGYEASYYITGTEWLEYKLGYETTGDRWSIRDNCIIWKTDKEQQLQRLYKYYYKDVTYAPNLYEYLAVLAYSHWIPEIIAGTQSEERAQYFGFSYTNAWFELCHELSSTASISLIRQYVKDNIANKRDELNPELYTQDQINALLPLVINMGDKITTEIYKELVDRGYISNKHTIDSPAYGYQHAKKYGIMYLYAYIALEEIYYNAL